MPWSIVLLAAGGLLACVMTALAHVSAHVVLSRRPWRPSRDRAPAISILKPLKGVDDDLEANLASFVDQAYDGPYEILLGAADPDDPALEVARRLKRRFPHRDIRVVAGHNEPGVNPKVANLAALSAHARHDTWLVSDSNVAVEPDYLATLACELGDPDVGVVSNLVVGVGGGNLGAVLENLHLNSFVLVAVCGAEVVARHPVVIGKSMLVRRAALEHVGGWSRIADVLGEDYVLGATVAQAGYRVVLSPWPVRTVNRTWTVDRFVSRHLRWSRMRRNFAPPIYALEPLLNPIPWLLGLALAAVVTVDDPLVALTGIVTAALVKVSLDAILHARLLGSWPSLLELAAIPLKDLWVLGLWVAGWLRSTVVWRGRRYRIGRGTRLVLEGPPGPSPRVPPTPSTAPATGYGAAARGERWERLRGSGGGSRG
ncbi:MAG: glycosyltransferase [Myxococcota bacterium]